MDWNGRPSVHVPLLIWFKRVGLSRTSHEMLQPHANLDAINKMTFTMTKYDNIHIKSELFTGI
jgi:hypothetical protein